MGPETRVPPLRWIFPLAQLFLCAVILWPMRSMLVGQIRTSLREYGTSHDTAARNPVAPRLRPFDLDLSDPDVQRRIRISEAREWAVAALNMPGGLPDLTYAILSPAHSEWTPRGMFMWTWRDLSWPIIGIFFWWLAGRSLQGLLFSRHKSCCRRSDGGRSWFHFRRWPSAQYGQSVCVSIRVRAKSSPCGCCWLY